MNKLFFIVFLYPLLCHGQLHNHEMHIHSLIDNLIYQPILSFTDTNDISESVSILKSMNLADFHYEENYDLYVDKYLEIEKKLKLESNSLNNIVKNELYYNLGDIYYFLFYENMDSCSLLERSYTYFSKSDSIDMATMVLIDYTMFLNLNNNQYNKSINLILNQFLILDSLSDNLYNDFLDEIIWSLKNNLALSYYNSDQFEKSKNICDELLLETKKLDTSEIYMDIVDYEIMNLINFANTSHKIKDYNQSIKYNARAIEIIDSLNLPETYGGYKNKIQRNLASVFISNFQYEEANKLLLEVKNNESDSTNIAILFYDLARIQTKQSEYINAIKNLNNSKNYFAKSDHYLSLESDYWLFKNYLYTKNPQAIEILEELIDKKISVLKNNECFLSSDANLKSQSDLLELIYYHINLNDNKIKPNYWFFIKNRDLGLAYNLYDQLDSTQNHKILKLKELQSKLYNLKQKKFIENLHENKYSELTSKIESSYADIYKNISCNKDYTNKSIKNLLKENEVLIDIAKVPILNDANFIHKKYNYFALIVEKNKPIKQVFVGSSDSLNYAYNLYETYIQGKSQDIILNSTSYDIMFSLIDSSIDRNKEIILFPEGVYSFVNPLTLFNKSKKKYLIDYRKISNINNLNDLLIRKEKIKDFNSITLFYNPLFNDNSQNKTINFTSKNRTIRGGKINPLPGTKTEGEEIERICKIKNIRVEKFSGKDANEENFKSTKLGDILHFATHGYYFNKYEHQMFFPIDTTKYISPYLLNGLLLTRAENTLNNEFKYSENGWLTGLEIQSLDFSEVNLIILSACETMIGKEIEGRGVFSLSHSLKIAGGRNIISSLWKVDDEATKQLMINFYEKLNNTSDINKCLYSAILELRNTYSHPYYWGPFIYQY